MATRHVVRSWRAGRVNRLKEKAARSKRWIWKELTRKDRDQVELFLRVWQRLEASSWHPPVVYRCFHSSLPPAPQEVQRFLQEPGLSCLRRLFSRSVLLFIRDGERNSANANRVCLARSCYGSQSSRCSR